MRLYSGEESPLEPQELDDTKRTILNGELNGRQGCYDTLLVGSVNRVD